MGDSTLCVDFIGCGLSPAEIAIQNADNGTLADEFIDNAATDTLSAARHKRDFAFQLLRHFCS
jgi:hypothetical protein